MNARDWDNQDHVAWVNEGYAAVVAGRIGTALGKFAKSPDDPGRAVRLARAIDGLRREHDLDKMPWFNGLFDVAGFNDFKSFADYAAAIRVQQIVMRTQQRMNAMDANNPDPVVCMNICRDIDRMSGMVDSGLITMGRLQDFLENLDVNDDWPRMVMVVASIPALPVIARGALDPTLDIAARWQGFNEAVDARAVLEKHGGLDQVQGIDWEEFAQDRFISALQMTSVCVADDFISGDFGRASSMMAEAEARLAPFNSSFKRTDHMMAMGLSEDEAMRLVGMSPYAMLVEAIERLEQVPEGDIRVQGTIAFQIFDFARENDIDLTSAKTAEILGFPSETMLVEVLDVPAFRYLVGITGALEGYKGQPQKVLNQLKGIFTFLDVSGVEARHPDEAFIDNKIPLRKELVALQKRAEKEAAMQAEGADEKAAALKV